MSKKHHIDNEFDTECNQSMHNLETASFQIDSSTLQRAIDMAEYFNHHKLIMCGYPIQHTTTHDFINSLIDITNESQT